VTDKFRWLLLDWYRHAGRDLPWRRTRDPYAIWVSEVMLQQTRVATAIPYFERFLERFPTIASLAAASESELLGAWAGLGYYRRVRNMQRAAQTMGSAFPVTYEAIRALPGVGDYTAAAVASIAFGLPRAAVDGNVLRVLARVSNDSGDIATPAVRERIRRLADRLLDPAHPGSFNEAIMELGATVCLPRSPQCLVCPLESLCAARAAGTQCELPVKTRPSKPERVARTLYVMRCRGSVLFWQRPNDSPRLAGFWELPEPEHFLRTPSGRTIGSFKHSITNRTYSFEVCSTKISKLRPELNQQWLCGSQMSALPLSTTARKALAICRLFLK
jgi:A/G-specific adenine glycosylase